jgi:DNA-binding GntR family transcriptional regulator
VQIADDLRAQIKDGRLRVGTKMPSQRKLAEQYQVASMTLRSALDELAGEGVITAGSTRGTFIVKMPGDPDPTVREIMEMLTQLIDRIDRIEGRISEIERR